jgi:hypothetical protein
MNLQEIEMLTCTFENCSVFELSAQPTTVLEFFESDGGEFIHPQFRVPRAGQLDVVHELAALGGSWSGVSLRHPALQPELYDYSYAAKSNFDPLSRSGAGSFSYIPETRTLSLNQNTDYPEPDAVKAPKMERNASGLIQFLYHFAPLLRPSYACITPVIDPEFDSYPCSEFRETGTVAYLCWANYIGLEIVQQVGEEFLRTAPGWKCVQLPCGGFLYIVTEKFLDWQFAKHRHYVKYFRQMFPNIEEL